jgi:hypothetical protein
MSPPATMTTAALSTIFDIGRSLQQMKPINEQPERREYGRSLCSSFGYMGLDSPNVAISTWHDVFATSLLIELAFARQGRFVIYALEFYWVDQEGRQEELVRKLQAADSQKTIEARARATIKNVLLGRSLRRANLCVIKDEKGKIVSAVVSNSVSPDGARIATNSDRSSVISLTSN